MTDKTTEDTAALMAKIEALTASVTKLETKNSELIDREKKAKDAADKAALEADERAADAARSSKDVEGLETRLNAQHKREMDKVTKERDAALKERDDALQTIADRDTQIKNDAIELTIANAFSEHKVFDQHKRALTAMFKAELSADENLDLKETIAAYFASDEGGHYVPAPENGGGASTHQQTNVKASAHSFTKENFASREGEWLQMSLTNPTLAKSIAVEVGRNDLAATL